MLPFNLGRRIQGSFLVWGFEGFFFVCVCVLKGFLSSFIISILKPCTNSAVFRCVELATESHLITQITGGCFRGGNREPGKLLSCSLGCHNYFLFFCYLELFYYLKIGRSATRGSPSNLKIYKSLRKSPWRYSQLLWREYRRKLLGNSSQRFTPWELLALCNV